MNVGKKKSMLICTKPRRRILNSNAEKQNLVFRDRELDLVDEIKYLGVHVDYSLVGKNISNSKVSRGMGMLKYAK